MKEMTMMNDNTLRFGVFRTLAFAGLLVAGMWAGEAMALTPAPLNDAQAATLLATAQSALKADGAVALKRASLAHFEQSLVRTLASVDLATRNDLISKAASAARLNPRGFGLVAPVLIVNPTQ